MIHTVKHLSLLAHDLKNSLGNGLMYAELLAADLEELAEDYPELAGRLEGMAMIGENIRHSNDKLLSLINSWVLSHQLMEGTLEEYGASVNVRKVMDRIINSNRLYLDKKKIALSRSWDQTDIDVRADNDLLALVLDNMLVQMLTFADTDDRIDLVMEDQKGFVKIEMADSCGFQREEVVDRFLCRKLPDPDDLPREGILKITSYGMIFCGLMLRQMDARPSVEKNSLGGLTFSFYLKR